MSKAWQKLNLEGGGLQAVNAVLANEMRSRNRAYAAWILFPLGLHRFYLAEPRGGAVFVMLSVITVGTAWLAPAWWWLLPSSFLALLAVHDLFWIDRQVVAYNKQLRMQLFLRKGKKPPTDYRGRYTDENDAEAIARDLADYQALKEGERAGHVTAPQEGSRSLDPTKRRRQPSFNEQEALLRELAKKRRQR
jgi:TM2 domain-containing membrane protein YozV